MPPPGYRKPNVVWRLKRSLYGLRRSPQRFNEHFASEMVKLGFSRCVGDPQVFFHAATGSTLSAHVDDLLVATPPTQTKAICDSIDTAFKIKWGGYMDDKHWERYLGREWRRAPHGYR
eukprot:15159766-Heterocapsa_arctica.AAC.1